MSTLFTFRVHACEKDKLQIRCPYGTTITVEEAIYGRQVPSNEMCPPIPDSSWLEKDSEERDLFTEDTNCLAKDSLKVR